MDGRRRAWRVLAMALVGLACACSLPAAELSSLLEEGKWARADKKAKKEIRSIVEQRWRDPTLGRQLGELLRVRAVAAANLGDESGALWLWHLAIQLHFPLATRAGQQPGMAGEIFAANPLRSAGRAPGGISMARPDVTSRFERPVVPELPAFDLRSDGARQDRPAPLRFEVFVDREGRPSHPRLEGEPNPVFVVSVLQAWMKPPSFEPARLEGEPIPWIVPFEVPIRVTRW